MAVAGGGAEERDREREMEGEEVRGDGESRQSTVHVTYRKRIQTITYYKGHKT